MHSTLNRVFRVIWCKVRMAWVAVSEVTSGCGKVQSSTRHAQREVAGGQTAVGRRLSLSLLAMATAMAVGTALAGPPLPQQLPTGAQVVAGQASIVQNTNAMTVNQASQRAIINWNTFNVGSQAQVNFVQPSQSSVALNRVLSSDPSQIYGQINANGQVYLVNPAGVYFAPGAAVNVGGIVATTHQMADADFMAGRSSFNRNGATGSVINEGHIQTALGGYIAMLAPEVRNGGVLLAQSGTVALAAGEQITLNFSAAQGGQSHLDSLTVSAAQIDTLVENRQAVRAPGGLIILSAQAASQLRASVVNSGSLEAQGVSQVGGRIVLDAGPGGNVLHSGRLSVASDSAQGGQVSLTGDNITLNTGSHIDASGASGGGTVLVGGDWQGSGTLQQARTVTLQQGASIDASATRQGDGGKVVLWSDVHQASSMTRAQGTVLAKGGAQGGNGGQVETSGHSIDIDGFQVNTRSASDALGKTGLWLIDPYTYDIYSAQATTIGNALNSSDVTITTATSNPSYGANGSGAGRITFWSGQTPITKTASGTTTLTLKADEGVWVASDIISTGGALNVVLWSDNANANLAGSNIQANITTNGGHLWAGGSSSAGGSSTWNGLTVGNGPSVGSNGYNWYGMDLQGNISTSGGSVLLWAAQGKQADMYGIGLSSTRMISTGSGNVTLLTNQIYNAANNGILTINSTGKLTFAPADGAWTNGFSFTGNYWSPTTLTLDNIGGTGQPVDIQNIASLSGLTIGHYNGMSGLTQGNTGNVTIGSATSIAGPITVYGGNISLNADIASTLSGADLTISATGNVGTSNTAKTVQTNNGNLTIIADSDGNNSGSLDLDYTTYSAGSGNMAFKGNTFSWTVGPTTSPTITNTTGAFTFSSVANSFGQGVDTGWFNFPTTLSSFTVGNAGNTFDITVGTNALSVAGPISLYGGNIALNSNLTSTATASDVLVKARGNILQSNGTSITANGGNVTYWADADNSGAGNIVLNANAAITTAGGHIVMGGGLDPLTGYASGASASNSTTASGIYSAANLSLNSGGGDITMHGQSFNTSAQVVYSGIYFNNNATSSTLNAGTGKVLLNGIALGSGSANAQGVTLVSSQIGSASTAADAITITGNGSGVSSAWTSMGVNFGGAIEATGTGGGINITGRAAAASVYSSGVDINGNVLASSGNISMAGLNTGTYVGIQFTGSSSIGSKAATNVTSSSSHVTVTGDVVSFNATTTVTSTGALLIQSNASSFASALSTSNLSLGTALTGLTVGKDSNTANVTIGNAANISGPISVYGGNVTLSGSLISTAAGSSVLVKAFGKIASGANSLTYQTNNGSLVFWSNANSSSGGGINFENTGLTFNTANGSTSQTTGGGDLVFGGGAAVDANGRPTGAAVSAGIAISFNARSAGNSITKMYTGGGNITLNGTSSGSTGIDFAQASLIDAGTGALRITGNSTANGHGVQFNAYGGATNGTVVTAQGIELTGAGAYATHPTNFYGIYSSNNFVNLSSTGSGNLNITGTSSGTGGHGIDIRGTGFDFRSASGNVSLTGTATGSTAIALTSAGNISSTAGGSITVNGTSNDWTGLAEYAVVNYTTTSGNISILASGGGSSFAGLYLYGGNISTGTGNVLIQGQSNGHVGVYFTNAATNVTTAGGSITVNGTSNTYFGIYSDQAVSLNTSAGSGGITIIGTSNTSLGVYANANLDLISAAGNIVLTGTSGPGAAAGAGQGVYINKGNVSTTTGNITLTGTSDSNAYGLDFGRDTGIANVTSTTGNITLTGITGTGSQGLNFYGSNISTGANINLTSSTQMRLDGKVYSTGAGSIVLRANSFTHSAASAAGLGTNGSIAIVPYLDTAGFSAAVNTSEFNLNPTISNVSYAANSLVIGNTYNTQAVNWNAVGNVAGPISVYGGTVQLTANMNSSATGDVWIQANNNADNAAYISSGNNLYKTGGALSTITLRSNGRVRVDGSITASNTGGANVVLWSDYGNNNTYGVAGGIGLSSAVTSNGGNVWAGGSSTANGSLVWKGLTVGDGPSVGTSGGNYRAYSLGNISTAGGDVLLWAGSGYTANGISEEFATTINAGTGNVTFIAPSITNRVVTVNTTGVFTWAPNTASDWGATGTWNGSTAAGNFSATASTTFANLTLANVATLGGLTLGQYDGMTYSNGTVRSLGTSSNVSMNSTMAIAGAYRIYGDNVTVSSALSSNATGQSLLYADNGNVSLNAAFNQTNGSGSSLTLQASGNITQAAGANITASGNSTLDVVVLANEQGTLSTTAVTATLANISTNGGSIWVGGSTSGGARQTWHGRTVGNSGSKISLLGNLSLGAGDALLWQVPVAALSSTNANIIGSTGTVVLVSDAYSGTALGVYTHGTLNLESSIADFGGNLVWNGSYHSGNSTLVLGLGTALAGLQIGNYAHNLTAPAGTSLSSLVVGNYSGTGLVGDTVYSFANTGNVTVQSDLLLPGTMLFQGANITLNGHVGAGGTGALGMTLRASGDVTQGANSTVSNGVQFVGGNVTLTNVGNQISAVAATGVRDLAVVSSYDTTSALGLQGISASGQVSIKNQGGILVDGAISTTSTANSSSAPALLLASGYDQPVGNTSYNVNLNGAQSVSVGSGGLGLIYTGSTGSWGLATLVGSGSGHFRYSSNLSSAGYNTTAAPLTSGLYALYRETPALTISVATANVSYGDPISNALTSTAVNGDTFTQMFGAGNEPMASIGGNVSTAGHYTAGNHAVTISGATGNVLGYAQPSTNNGTLTIAKANLTVAGTAVDSKTYDGSITATFSNGGTLVGVKSNGSASDAVTLSTSGAFSSKNAGTAVALTMADSISGADADNYQLVQPTVTANINQRLLSLSATQGYSGNATLGNVSLGNLLSGETLTYTATANSSQVADNGNNFISAITLGNQAGATAVAGGLASNYRLPTTLDVSSAPVTISAAPLGISANASYNGGNAFNGLQNGTHYVLTGLVGGETISTANLTVSSANVSDNSSNRITGLVVASGNASMSNYVLASSRNATLGANSTNVFTVDPASLTVTANNRSKAYGDAVAFAGTEFTYSGNVSGQTVTGVTLASAGAVNTAPVNGGAAYAISAANASGANGFVASNYRIRYVSGSLTLNPAPLGISASGVYNGSTLVAPTAFTVTGLVNGETVNSIASLVINNANVASANRVGAIHVANGTADMANYVLNASQNSTANTTTTNTFTLSKAPLTVQADNAAIFIGESLPGSHSVSYHGFVNGETALTASGLSTGSVGNSANANSGAGSYTLTPSGWSADNYSLSHANGSFTIVPAHQLLIQTGALTGSYGTAATLAPASVQYMAGNGTVVNLSLASSQGGNGYVYSDGHGGSVTFTLSPANAALSGSGNLKADSYQMSGAVDQVTGSNFNGTAVYTGSLAVAPITVSPSTSSVSKVYDGSTGMNGLSIDLHPAALAGDGVTATGAGAFTSRHVGSNLGYTVSGLMLGGADAGNYVLSGGANTFSGSNGQIVAKTVTLTPQATSKTYDGSTTASVNLGDFSRQLGVAGDSVTALTVSFDDKNVGTGKTLTPSGAAISDGNGGNNYRIVYANASTGTVTRLNAVSWVGGATGNWFDPANWAGGAVPDLSNVANVLIPSGVTVSFNNTVTPPAQSGPVNIDSLGGASGKLSQTAGTLNVGAGGVTLDTLNVSGGSTTVGGDTNVGNLNLSGGNVSSQGNLNAGNVSMSNGTLVANANMTVNGSYSQIGGNATVAGDLSATHYSQSGGAINVNGNLSAADYTQSGGSTNVNGTLTATDYAQSNGSTTAGNLSANSANLSGGTTTVSGGTTLGNLTLSGGNVTSQGNLNAGNVSMSNGTLVANANMTVNGSYSQIGGNATVAGNLSSGTYNQSGGNATVAGDLSATHYSQSGGAINVSGGLTAADYTQSGGSTNVNGTLTATDYSQANGATTAGNLSTTHYSQVGGTTSVNGSLSTSAYSQVAGSTLANGLFSAQQYSQSGGLTTAHAGVDVNGAFAQTGGLLDVVGTANISTAGTLQVGNLSVAGDLNAQVAAGGVMQVLPSQMVVTGNTTVQALAGTIALQPDNTFMGTQHINDQTGDRNNPVVVQQTMVAGGTPVSVDLPQLRMQAPATATASNAAPVADSHTAVSGSTDAAGTRPIPSGSALVMGMGAGAAGAPLVSGQGAGAVALSVSTQTVVQDGGRVLIVDTKPTSGN